MWEILRRAEREWEAMTEEQQAEILRLVDRTNRPVTVTLVDLGPAESRPCYLDMDIGDFHSPHLPNS